MKIMTVACTLGAALVLCSLGTSGAAAQARKAHVVREPRQRLVVTVPVVTPTPWDYYIVPRYRYRPQDDRVDPYGPPPSIGSSVPPLASQVYLYGGWPYW